jgi:predicted methyltransferase
MLSSIRKALRRGGTLALIDFERIPGKSSDWILGHVRAGKAEVKAEVIEAGFRFCEEIDLPELEENYFLRFEKK